MSTKNNLPFSNQFERGHSFNWAEEWTIGKYYMNDEYVTDFVRYENAILACRKNHKASEELKPVLILIDGKVVDVDSPYWSFVVAARDEGIVVSSTYIAAATQEDVEQDSSVIVGDPYIKIIYSSGAYTYVPAKDLVVGISVGVPIMTQEMLDNLPEQSIPDQYILMAQESDIKDATGGNYLTILFSAIRKLQAEVAKLRNSFQYGIESYTGKNTAVSAVVSGIKEEQDEPLWSIDENDLSVIPEATIDFYAPTIDLLPHTNIDYSANGYARISNTAVWTDVNKGYESIEDTKIFLYLTTTSTNIGIGLKDGDIALNLNLRTILDNFEASKFNICVLVSRKMVGDDDIEYGKNYIWISASYFGTNVTFAEGYLNLETGLLQSELYEIDSRFTIGSVSFTDLTLYKFNAYSQYQDFSHEVIPSKPSDQDYKYKAAHLTIRAVENLSELESIENRLLTEELIYQEDKGILWIKSKTGLRAIGNGSSPESGMTVTEMLEELQKRGLIYQDASNPEEVGIWQMSNISDVTFINNQTGKRFKFEVNAEGDLKSQEIPDETLTEIIDRLSNPAINKTKETRGFIGKLHLAENGEVATIDKDAKLNADRVKIGAVYCPLSSDTKFGCSHGYIELENTSNKDVPLEGCYLHFYHPDKNHQYITDSLPLTGILPAGGTYLIRCKHYADADINADVIIDVTTYDQEWYKDGELLDVSLNQEYSGTVPTYSFAFILTYGETVDGSVISSSTVFRTLDDNSIPVYAWNFIDYLVIDKTPGTGWSPQVVASRSNTVIRNTFELDPAKQAYQALHAKDSSRLRLANVGNDIQYLDLSARYIKFPVTDEVYDIKKFTPKASFEHKNVCTDKSKIDKAKPNMVTCSFGRNMLTTRTFNWVSAGEYDEYVFIKNENSWIKIESYKHQTSEIEPSLTFPRRVEFNSEIVNTIYQRMFGDFPGDGSHYTAHKCIIDIVNEAVQSPTTYTYVVGRADKDGNPDLEHCSEEYTFTLYPSTYTPRIYQITDQQGFHWIEYQVWAAAALQIESQIQEDIENDHIIPVLINTGDMTQNGTRINEWFDYYNAGKPLFRHLEQMNVVGNNDLCNTDVNALGTGDDNGKSNGYYFHVFYCYEINPSNVPIINGKYVPSLYDFGNDDYTFMMINSEITYVNCDKWFNKHKNTSVVNIYTGWTVPSESGITPVYDNSFTSIYTMIYRTLNRAKNIENKNVIAVCHEMPFTVITKDSLENVSSVYSRSRSFGGSGTSLIGSHTNQLNQYDTIGIFWLSRLLEHFQVKLMIGGHKHTYACTFPLRENYYYYDIVNGEIDETIKSSKSNGPMVMYETLEQDNRVEWIHDGRHLSKFPLSKYRVTGDADTGVISWAEGTKTMNVFAPIEYDINLTGGVTYLMCQATGYKLKSNKELPSTWQQFSKLIPETTVKADGSDGPDKQQQRPMYIVIDMTGNNYTAQLIRIDGILNSSQGFTQIDNTPMPVNIVKKWASVSEPSEGYASTRYATWSTTKTNLISI